MPFLIVESEWRVINPPLTPTTSPKIFNQSLEIAILFNIVESSGDYVFEDTPPSHRSSPQGKGRKLCRGGIKVFIESVVVETSKGLIQLEIEMASAFFSS